MKFYYINYSFTDGEYEEMNEQIIEAENQNHAIEKLEKSIGFSCSSSVKISIDIIYETTSDARI